MPYALNRSSFPSDLASSGLFLLKSLPPSACLPRKLGRGGDHSSGAAENTVETTIRAGAVNPGRCGRLWTAQTTFCLSRVPLTGARRNEC